MLHDSRENADLSSGQSTDAAHWTLLSIHALIVRTQEYHVLSWTAMSSSLRTLRQPVRAIKSLALPHHLPLGPVSLQPQVCVDPIV